MLDTARLETVSGSQLALVGHVPERGVKGERREALQGLIPNEPRALRFESDLLLKGLASGIPKSTCKFVRFRIC